MEKKYPKKGTEVAGSFFHPSYYHNSDELSQGFATTHEQVSDVYAEGEIGAVVETDSGEEIPLQSSEE